VLLFCLCGVKVSFFVSKENKPYLILATHIVPLLSDANAETGNTSLKELFSIVVPLNS